MFAMVPNSHERVLTNFDQKSIMTPQEGKKEYCRFAMVPISHERVMINF